MNDRLSKYIFSFFLINTVFFAIPVLSVFADYIFLFIMISLAIIIIFQPKLIKSILIHKKYSPFIYFNLINFIYFVFFEINNFDSFKYFSARFLTFSLISFAIEFNHEYFKLYFFKNVYYFLFSLGILSFLLLPNFSNRFYGIFSNPNALASLMITCFSIKFLLFNKNTILDWIQLFLILALIIYSGSRMGIFALVLAFCINYNFSFRSIFNFFLISVIIYFGYDFLFYSYSDNAIARLINTDLINNRILNYLFAYETFKSKWLLGHGLSNYAFIDPNIISVEYSDLEIGAHNGYLAILVQYGLIFSLLFFSIFFKALINIFKYVRFNWNKKEIKFYFFVIIYTLVNAFGETMFTGINDFQTLFFWFVFAYLYTKSYKWSRDLK